MNEKQHFNFKQISFVFVKLVIVIGAFYFIYNKLIHNEQLDLQKLIATVKTNHVFKLEHILLILILTIANWFFEILKWQTLISVIKHISFFEATKQSLAAHTAAIFTPNKIGEFGAKAIYFEKKSRKKIVLLTFLSNIYQLGVTVLFGSIGIVLLDTNFDLNILEDKLYKGSLALLFIFSFFYLGNKSNRFTIKGYSLEKLKSFMSSISKQVHAKAILYSIIRYVFFSHQFYCILIIFNINISYQNALILICSMYLISSLIPMLFLFDIVVKGSLAVWLFSFLGIDELLILSVVTIMWIFNFVLPSFFGSYFVLNFNAHKQLKLEE